MKNKPDVTQFKTQYTIKRYYGVACPLTKCFVRHWEQRWINLQSIYCGKDLICMFIIKLRQVLHDIKPAVIR